MTDRILTTATVAGALLIVGGGAAGLCDRPDLANLAMAGIIVTAIATIVAVLSVKLLGKKND